LSDGVSLWPPILLRVFAGFLCVAFLVRAKIRLQDNAALLAADFGLETTCREANQAARRLLSRHRPRKRDVSISRWRTESGRVDAIDLWRRYLLLGSWRYRLARIVPLVLLFMLFGFVVLSLSDRPYDPARGNWSAWCNKLSLVFSVPLLIGLTYYVVDATRLCEAFVSHLRRRAIVWPPEVLERFRAERELQPDDARTWLPIRVIAMRTKAIGVLVTYPFIALVPMMAARLSYFDAVSFPTGLLVIVVAVLVHAIAAAFLLRSGAEHARSAAIEELERGLVVAAGSEEGGHSRSEQIKLAISSVHDLHEGAFARLNRHPVFGALLAAPGGVGLIALIEYLASP
jgi:hypothetical protein